MDARSLGAVDDRLLGHRGGQDIGEHRVHGVGCGSPGGFAGGGHEGHLDLVVGSCHQGERRRVRKVASPVAAADDGERIGQRDRHKQGDEVLPVEQRLVELLQREQGPHLLGMRRVERDGAGQHARRGVDELVGHHVLEMCVGYEANEAPAAGLGVVPVDVGRRAVEAALPAAHAAEQRRMVEPELTLVDDGADNRDVPR